jgi:hypothetical protein
MLLFDLRHGGWAADQPITRRGHGCKASERSLKRRPVPVAPPSAARLISAPPSSCRFCVSCSRLCSLCGESRSPTDDPNGQMRPAVPSSVHDSPCLAPSPPSAATDAVRAEEPTQSVQAKTAAAVSIDLCVGARCQTVEVLNRSGRERLCPSGYCTSQTTQASIHRAYLPDGR